MSKYISPIEEYYMSDLVDSLKNEEGLDERDQYFLDILFDECEGDFIVAMDKAGYKGVSVSKLRKRLSKQIKQASKDYLVSATPKAAAQLVKVFKDPSSVGARNIISAAKEILDRGDVNKEEQKLELPENVVVLLPPKRSDDEAEA